MEDVIISQTTGRVGIRLCHPERDPRGNLEYFSVEVSDPTTIRAQTRVYAYHPESLAALFDEMAREWRGWSGAKEWASVEGELTLSCTTDGKRHVDIAIRVKESLYPDSWRVQATALVEAGQLEAIAKSVRAFIAHSGRAA